MQNFQKFCFMKFKFIELNSLLLLLFMNYYHTQTDSGYPIVIPLTFRDYKVIKTIGKGSFAAVVEVTEINTNINYAAKIIPKKSILTSDQSKMIENEIQILQKICHPNIIKLYEAFTLTNSKNEEYVILIQELCSNGSLFKYVMTHGFKNEREKRMISRKITEAVEYLHNEGLAHADIKPENVLLDKHKNPKLCDFNLSKIVNEADPYSHCGSCLYAAPEMFQSGPVNFQKADIWSLGMMLYSISEMSYPYRSLNEAHKGILFYNTNNNQLIKFTKRSLNVNPLRRSNAHELLNDPYLTLNYENNDDSDMLFILKQDSISKAKTSPNLTKINKLNEKVKIDDDNEEKEEEDIPEACSSFSDDCDNLESDKLI